jgi:flavodoxin
MNDLGKLTQNEVAEISEIQCGNKGHLLALIQGEEPARTATSYEHWLFGAPVYVYGDLPVNVVKVLKRNGGIDVYVDGVRQ